MKEFGGPEIESLETQRIINGPTRLPAFLPPNPGSKRVGEAASPGAHAFPLPQLGTLGLLTEQWLGHKPHCHLTAAGYIGHQASGTPLALL